MADRFQRITPFLWFNDNAEEAVRFYVSIFKNSRIGLVTHYTKESSEASGQTAGSVMTIAFELDGQHFTAINGGPHFRFNEAISLVVNCESQDEIDYYWDKLTAGGGGPLKGGWLKDRFGVSWQVVPEMMPRLLQDPDRARASRAMKAMLKMKKIVIADIEAAANGTVNA
jgi:predicted 3-demethylubiquinone-9 3-methyltransferase (glyoxalase superfamily)